MDDTPAEARELDALLERMFVEDRARRAALSPEARAAEDAVREARRQAHDAKQARLAQVWAPFLAVQEQGEDAQRAAIWQILGGHDFFRGPGPALIGEHAGRDPAPPELTLEILDSLEASRQGRSASLLHYAVQEAGFQGRVVLCGVWLRHGGGNGPWVCYHELLALDAKLAFKGYPRWPISEVTRWEPTEVSRVIGYLRVLQAAGYLDVCLVGLVRHFPIWRWPLVHAWMAAESGPGIPVADAWVAQEDYARGLSYADIPQWPAVRVAGPKLLSEGVVVYWPPTAQRVRIRLDAHPNFQPSEWACDLQGERILHVEPTEDPLTPEVPPNARQYLQIFGQGRSQQDAKVPVLDGRPAMVLLTWHDPHDYTVCISATLGEDTMPIIAWVDGSCT